MIKPIVSLDELTINQIAAGEVIERPASVVKELVENSVDAESTRITVEINNTKDYIKIVDNGTGIPKEDMKNAFERHATSKLRSAEDLNDINTMGFRGEALPSIASVSVVEMLSKVENEPGNKLVIAGNKIFEFVPAGIPQGTSITVSKLFGNVPARKKFLKSDTSENRYILEMLEKLALVNKDISFTLIINGERRLHTRGKGTLKDAIYDIFSGEDKIGFKKDVEENLLDVDYETENLKISGVVGKPELSRSNRKRQIFYVNGRNVVDKNIIAAVDLAFKGRLMPGRHAFTILNITLDPSLVDVNVHPAKLEVRFKNEQEVFSGIKSALENALSTENRLEKALKNLNFDARTNLGETYSEKIEESRLTKSPKQLRKEALRKLKSKKLGLDIKLDEDELDFENIFKDKVETKEDEIEELELRRNRRDEYFANTTLEEAEKSENTEALLEDILKKRAKYGAGYATKDARERYKESVKNKFAKAKKEFEQMENKKEFQNVSEIIENADILENEDKDLVKEILEIDEKPKENNEKLIKNKKEKFSKKLENINSGIEEANKRLQDIQNMSQEERKKYIADKLEKYNKKYKSNFGKKENKEDKEENKDIKTNEDKDKDKNKNIISDKLEEISETYSKINSEKYKRKTKEEEINEEYENIYSEINALKEKDLSKLNHMEGGDFEEELKEIEEKLGSVKKYLEKEMEENSKNGISLEENEENLKQMVASLGLEEEESKYILEESKNLEETLKKLDELEEKEIEKANNLSKEELNQKLEEEKGIEKDIFTNEIKENKGQKVDFNEMYKKAFGEEVYEKRKEREEDKEKQEELMDGISTAVNAENVSFFGNKKIPYKIIGTVFKTYIIIEIGDDMYMIDQHAAHERVLYEEIKNRYYSGKENETQMLLLPDIITLSHLEMEIIRKSIDVFEKMGFTLELFGINSVKLTGVPMRFEEYNTKELFLDILDELSGETNTTRQEIEDNFLATIACKAAVKANMYLTDEEIKILLDKMLTLENPFSCPHGRPSTIKFNKYKIERKFNRKL